MTNNSAVPQQTLKPAKAGGAGGEVFILMIGGLVMIRSMAPSNSPAPGLWLAGHAKRHATGLVIFPLGMLLVRMQVLIADLHRTLAS